MSVPPDVKSKNELTRFLYTGKEVAKYYPGCWTTHKYFEEGSLQVVDRVLADNNVNTEIIDIILKAHAEGKYSRFDTIIFALVKCIAKGAVPVKEAAYKAVRVVCQSPEQLFLFVKYAKHLNIGYGSGWCKTVKSWYTSRNALDLARELARVKGRHGRTHVTLIHKSHLKIDEDDVARSAVLKYSMFGLRKARAEYGSVPAAGAALAHLQTVDALRLCEDAVAAAQLVTEHRFTLHYVPAHLLTAQEVWEAVLPQMSLQELLSSVQRIHNMGFLKAGSSTVAKLGALLLNPRVISSSNIHPIAVYIALCNYRNKGRPLKHEKRKIAAEKEKRRRTRQTLDPETGTWVWTVTRRHPRETKIWGIDLPPNTVILSNLETLLERSWTQLPPTGKSYLVTLDMRDHMFKAKCLCRKSASSKPPRKKWSLKTSRDDSKAPVEVTLASPLGLAGPVPPPRPIKTHNNVYAKCFYNEHVTPGHAGIIMALHLLKREADVTVAVFTNEGIEVVNLGQKGTKITLQQAEEKFRQVNAGWARMEQPFTWATTNNRRVDVFINVLDRVTRSAELPRNIRTESCVTKALLRYRQRVPDAKLITMSLASHKISLADPAGEGMLDIVGIDEAVPGVMDAFANGLFT